MLCFIPVSLTAFSVDKHIWLVCYIAAVGAEPLSV